MSQVSLDSQIKKYGLSEDRTHAISFQKLLNFGFFSHSKRKTLEWLPPTPIPSWQRRHQRNHSDFFIDAESAEIEPLVSETLGYGFDH